MRSVADRLRLEDREAVLRLSPADRVALALSLGERDLEAFRASQRPSLSRDEVLRRRRVPFAPEPNPGGRATRR